MPFKASIRKHGSITIKALLIKYAQLHDVRIFDQFHELCLPKKQKKGTLNLLSAIKEKRNSFIKSSCTNSSQQDKHKSKEEYFLLTTHTDLAILLAIVNAHKNRDTVVANAKGAYLHAKIDKFISVVLRD